MFQRFTCTETRHFGSGVVNLLPVCGLRPVRAARSLAQQKYQSLPVQRHPLLSEIR